MAEEPEKTRDEEVAEYVEALADVTEGLTPLEEFARGQRERLQRDGWSPTQAEIIAARTLIEMSRAIMFRAHENGGGN